jgi:hypothetical protein
LAPRGKEEGRNWNQSRHQSNARERRRQTTSRNTNTGNTIPILAANNGEKGELIEKQGYGESILLSSEWERSPNYPPPRGAVPVLQMGLSRQHIHPFKGALVILSKGVTTSARLQNRT